MAVNPAEVTEVIWPSRVQSWVLRHSEIVGLIGIYGAFLVIYGNAVAGFFVQDDFDWLVLSRFQTFREYLGCFSRFNVAATYRPLSQETFFWVGQKAFGLWPPGFHIVSFVVFLLGTAVLYRVIRVFFPVLPSLAGAFFFAVHGAHFRSVYWISALPEPLAFLFFAGAILAFLVFVRNGSRPAYFIGILSMLLGMFSKESILSLPLVLSAYCIVFARRKILYTAPFFLVSASYIVLRAHSKAVGMAPYPLAAGQDLWNNLASYCSWASGFSQQLLEYKLAWNPTRSHIVIALAFIAVVLLFVACSKEKRIALFALLWFLLGLQPVLYFREYIDTYYLAPALGGLSLLLASFLSSWPPRKSILAWSAGTALLCWVFWASHYRVHAEGRWWNDRAEEGRNIINRMRDVDAVVPKEHLAVIFGFSPSDYGTLMGYSAFRAFGFAPARFILMGIAGSSDQIRNLFHTSEIRNYDCFVYSKGEFTDRTVEFRENPEPFLDLSCLRRVELVANAPELIRGKDTLRLKVQNIKVPAIDLRYSVDGASMPDMLGWALDESQTAVVFVSAATKPGTYHLQAVRDSRTMSPLAWHRVDVRIKIR